LQRETSFSIVTALFSAIVINSLKKYLFSNIIQCFAVSSQTLRQLFFEKNPFPTKKSVLEAWEFAVKTGRRRELQEKRWGIFYKKIGDS
jgi:hypothetical protein